MFLFTTLVLCTLLSTIQTYIEESNGNKYLTLKTHHKSMEKYGAKSKILLDQQIITQVIMMKKNMKIKFNPNDNLSLKKTLELYDIK